jgi:hypothetical protein
VVVAIYLRLKALVAVVLEQSGFELLEPFFEFVEPLLAIFLICRTGFFVWWHLFPLPFTQRALFFFYSGLGRDETFTERTPQSSLNPIVLFAFLASPHPIISKLILNAPD